MRQKIIRRSVASLGDHDVEVPAEFVEHFRARRVVSPTREQPPVLALVNDLLAACERVTILATSREPVMVAGEVTWQVPSLSLSDEAIELFIDRARRARPGFTVDDGNADTVTEICRRLDGMPLAIELAAARVRSLSLDEIVDSLHDRFRLLTGGARTAVRRQQTLRASVD
jgi:predicted ATPase